MSVNILNPEKLKKLFSVPDGLEAAPMDRYEWWSFMDWSRRRRSSPSLYEFVMYGMVKYRTEIVRWDHPGKRLVERYFRNDEIRMDDV